MSFNNNVYDVLKWIAQILLPAIVTLYAALGATWNLPYVEQISATIAAIDTFLGAVLVVSSKNYAEQNSKDETTEE